MPKKTSVARETRKSKRETTGKGVTNPQAQVEQNQSPTDMRIDVPLEKLIDADTFKLLTPAETRRLKADIKRGVDVRNSDILKAIVGRCPRVALNLNKILNCDPFAENDPVQSSAQIDRHNDSQNDSQNNNRDDVQKVTNSKKRRAVDVVDADDHQPKTKRNKLTEKQQLVNEKAKKQEEKKASKQSPSKAKSPRSLSGVKRKTRLTTTLNRKGFKRPVYDRDLGEIVENLGSDDSDDESIASPDEYMDDGFVVKPRGSRSKTSRNRKTPNARISNRRSKRQRSNDSDDSSNNDSDDMMIEDGSYDSQLELEEELNDLLDDTIENTEGLSEEQLLVLNQKMRALRERSSGMKVTVDMIVKANFNKEDEVWFYRNIRERLPMLEGNERFQLEDKIERRYQFLTSLQASNMYTNFFKGGERNIMEEILASKQPDSVKSVLLNRLCSVTYESLEEYQKALGWMDVVLSIPTEVKSAKNDISKSLSTLYHKLKANMHGMDSTIREILQAVCSILTDPDSKGSILTLVGPPGVGKTTISSMISESIGMGFGQVSCGSINDQATITGHGSTYIGSKPGVFTQYLITNKQLDNVILLDEMDKLHDSKIVPILLHVLDKSQNSRFRDAFCPEINIDLSKNLYVVAVNSVDNLDDALKDRLKIVHVNGYDVETKTQICIKHIIPALNKRTGIELHIDEDTVRRCVKKVSPNVSGVRDLERLFGDIYEKLLLITRMGGNLFNLPNSVKIESLKKIDAKLIKQLIGIDI
ncbi:ATP-dependent Lon protease [Yasminevirus sp. GU-2018]|uniref:ATP-dependent Lon protease n=1 Tax=Yasminevirus sp. GU-2018 TaxID=2420051 RepID=A0A5K0UAG1_9VIRU|nr:ATP-dependent Lon protease [Yasminevirus sp. GU-2018]